MSSTGAWSWAEDGDDPVEQALSNCQKRSSQPCKLYAVDNNVVWSNEPATTTTASAVQSAPSREATTLTGR
jgi:hypothetical protein